jgi:hypothetical protein
MLCGLGGHPGGEAFVEPQVVPPGHGDEIAGPQVRHLVGDDPVDQLLVAGARQLRVENYVCLAEEDRAPVLHRARDVAGRGHQVELRQRISAAEIVVVIGQELFGGLQGIARLGSLALADHDADRGSVDVLRHPLQVADSEEQQVRAHPWRRLEAHALETARQRLAGGLGHVGHRQLMRRHDGGDREHGLLRGLVEHRHEAPRVGRLKLGRQHPPAHIVDVEQARGAVGDPGGVVDGQHVRPRRDGRAGAEGGRLSPRVEAGGGRGAVHSGCHDGQVEGVDDEAIRAPRDLQGHLHVAAQRQLRGVRRERQVIGDRLDAGGQLRRDRRRGRRGE